MKEANFLDRMAQKYGCLPTDILEADAENLRIWKIMEMGNPSEQENNNAK